MVPRVQGPVPMLVAGEREARELAWGRMTPRGFPWLRGCTAPMQRMCHLCLPRSSTEPLALPLWTRACWIP